jgi:4-aminobutyrate aminotransferase-like enzyme
VIGLPHLLASNASACEQELAIGVEVADEDYAAEIGDTCRKNGLLVSAEEDVLMLFPALNISRATAERGLDIFERSLQ